MLFAALLVASVSGAIVLSQSAITQVPPLDYLVNPPTCPSSGWEWTFDLTHQNGDTQTASANAACTGPSGTGVGGSQPGPTAVAQVTHNPAAAAASTRATISLRIVNPDGSKVSPVLEIVTHLPTGTIRNFSQFPTCTESVLRASGPSGCPQGSRVGTGVLLLDARPVISGPINARLTAFNGENGELLIYVFPDIGPPFLIVGTPSTAANRPVLTLAIPPIHTLPSAPDASLVRLTLTLGETDRSGGCGGGYGGYGYNGYCAHFPATLDLKPETATNPVSTQHCVTATVKDVVGGGVGDVIVRFTVTGSVSITGHQATNASGEATFCYRGPATPGSDTIKAVAQT